MARFRPQPEHLPDGASSEHPVFEPLPTIPAPTPRPDQRIQQFPAAGHQAGHAANRQTGHAANRPAAQAPPSGDTPPPRSRREALEHPHDKRQHHAHDKHDQRGRHATRRGQNGNAVLAWTLLGSLIPGTGLIAAGRKVTGWLVLLTTLALLGGAVALVLFGDPVNLVLEVLGRSHGFLILAGSIAVLVVAWAALVLGTNASLRRFASLSVPHRALSTVLVAMLIALVAVPATAYGLIIRDTLQGVFSSDTTSTLSGSRPNVAKADPWAGTARVNVLLIGSDAGADRTGIRPDTLILASINTRSGDTVLISLPRNLQRVPFPPGTQQSAQYPGGFDCYDANGVAQCLLNALWTFGEEHWKIYYPDEPDAFHAGLRATSEGVEQITGQPVDQYAMVNLRGFMQMVNAIGGITVNVRERLPIGGNSSYHVATGGWIEAGNNQHLDGYHALWYARSRWSTDDYDRMRRQRCVIGAVVKQASPARVAVAFPQIAAAAKDNIITSVPLGDLSAWVQLADRVKQGPGIRSLTFTSSVINPSDPDIEKMRELTLKAITTEPGASPSATSSPSPSSPSSKPSRSPSPSSTPDSTTAQNVSDVC